MGKKYDAEEGDGRYIWESLHERLGALDPIEAVTQVARFGAPSVIHPRLGQGAFRVIVTDAYHRRCAVTGERTLPALDAAHIRPFSKGGGHEVSNGLLLRSNLHKLFDRGYVTVSPSGTFEVSRRIREEFENGRWYYDLHGREIAKPRKGSPVPSRDALEWHNENIFLG